MEMIVLATSKRGLIVRSQGEHVTAVQCSASSIEVTCNGATLDLHQAINGNHRVHSIVRLFILSLCLSRAHLRASHARVHRNTRLDDERRCLPRFKSSASQDHGDAR